MNQIVTFMRVRFQIVETVRIPDAVIKNELVTICTYGKSRRCGRKIPLPVILVQDMVAPLRIFTEKQWPKRHAIHVHGFRRFNATRVENGGRQIDILNHRLHHTGIHLPRSPSKQGDSNRLFKSVTLVIKTMLTQRKPVIPHVKHKRALAQF